MLDLIGTFSADTGGTVAITTDRTQMQVGPDSVRFGVDLSGSTFDTVGPAGAEVYDQRLHDLIFLWDTGDTGTWPAVQNVLSAWNDKSRAAGPWFAHCYSTPGDKTVNLTVIEPSSGKVANASVVITVTDPDTGYPTTQTVCINADGYAGANDWGPTGAQYVEWDTAQELFQSQSWFSSINTSVNRRFLLDTNQTYSGNYGFRFDNTCLFTNPYFGVVGAGRVALLSTENASTSAKLFYVENNYDSGGTIKDFRIVGIEASGTFDPTAQVQAESTSAGSFIRTNKYLDLVIHNCRSDKMKNSAFSLFMRASGDLTKAGYTHLDDVRATNMGGQYGGVFNATADDMADSSITLSGVALVQNPAAISGGAQHRAPLRIDATHKTNLRCCEAFGQDDSNAGWKICTTPSVEIGHIVNIDGISSEGNFMPLWIQQNHTQGLGRSAAINAVIDGAVIVADYTSHRLVESYATGVTLRNVLGIVPSSPRFADASVPGFDMNSEESVTPLVTYTTRTLQNAIGFLVGGSPPSETLSARCAVYNSTFVTERTAANNGGSYPSDTITFAAGLTNALAENNVKQGPWKELTGAETPFAPLATNTLWTPYCIGFTGYQTKTLVPEFATPVGAVVSGRPLAGSSALVGVVSGLEAYFDITGAVRTGTVTLGAWQGAG